MTITVGVPVHNGADLLDECLACLARQTDGDFRVLIHDNASTDATPEIAAGWAARDGRFRHHRHPTNIGPAANFAGLLAAAETPLFCWRAHDDLSADDFLAVCRAALDRAPGAALAAPAVDRQRIRAGLAGPIRRFPVRLVPGAPGTAGFRQSLGALHQAWFYGLWRRDAIGAIWPRILAAYPHAWASDFLILLAALAGPGIADAGATRFHQRLVAKASADATQRAPTSAAVLAERRRRFFEVAAAEAGLDRLEGIVRARLWWTLDRFTSRAAGSRGRIWKARAGLR